MMGIPMLRSLRCCLNPKVIGGLAAVGLALWLFAPGSGAAALPLLVLLICPLSMGAMMWGMTRRGGGSCGTTSPAAQTSATPADLEEQLRHAGEDRTIARARERLADGGHQPAS